MEIAVQIYLAARQAALVQDMGFEPMRIAPPRPQRGPVTALVILFSYFLIFLLETGSN